MRCIRCIEIGKRRCIEEGKGEGKGEGKVEVVRKLSNKFAFDDEKAASAAEVSLHYVKQIRTLLKKKN